MEMSLLVWQRKHWLWQVCCQILVVGGGTPIIQWLMISSALWVSNFRPSTVLNLHLHFSWKFYLARICKESLNLVGLDNLTSSLPIPNGFLSLFVLPLKSYGLVDHCTVVVIHSYSNYGVEQTCTHLTIYKSLKFLFLSNYIPLGMCLFCDTN